MRTNKYENIIAISSLALLLLLFASFLFDGARIITLGVLLVFGFSALCIALFCWLRRRTKKTTHPIKTATFAARFLCGIVLTAGVSLVTLLTSAATTYEGSYNCFHLVASSDGLVEISESPNGWTVLAYGTDGSCDAKNTVEVTFTITNTDTARGVSFDITVASADASPSGVSNGSKRLEAGGALADFSATSGAGSSACTTINISITNIVQDSLDIDVETTFEPRTGGTIKVDGTAITSQTKLTKKDGESYTLTATADAEYTFFGWMSSEGVLTTDGALSYVYSGKNAATLWPLFIRSDSAMYFIKGASPLVYYGYLDEAITAAGTSEKVVVVYKSGTAYHSKDGSEFDITIPENVTLLVPYDDNYTLCTTAPTVDGTTETWSAAANARKDPVVYRKLTMASGANITVNGAISISGMQCFAQRYNGMPTKATGVIAMEADSSITVNNGGFLYAWGYITGSGEISVMLGGTVYEGFQVKDWRGGTAASSMLNQDERVFPVSQYYVQNVEVKMTLYAGAIEKAYMSIVAKKVFGATTVPFIGSDGMFRLTNGYLVKDYLEDTDRLSVEIHGDLSMSALLLSVSTYNMDSSNYVLPITNNLRINVAEGTTTISQDVALLPGSELVIDEDATVELASGVKAFIYDLAEWQKKLFVYSSCDVSPLDYVGATGGKPNARPTMDDAKIEVNGTLDASLGYLYTTDGGANICSEGYGEVIIGTIDTSTVTYQATQSDTSITFEKIPITPAKLKHANGNYLTTADATAATTYNYNVAHGYWYAGTHGETTSTTPPTCTENGYTNHSCPCGYEKQDEVPALGHKWCTPESEGKTQTSTCENGCGEWVALTLQYRLDTYVWMNATVELSSPMVWGEPLLEDVKINDTKYYLVKKVLSDELIDDLTVSLPVAHKSVIFDVSFLMYKNNVYEAADAETKALLDAMIAYGTAADIYFDESKKTDYENDTTETPPTLQDANASRQDGPAAQIFGDVKLTTTGALIYFDEALRLGVQYHLTGLDANNEYVIDGKTYVVSQIGLLVLKDGDVNTPLTTTAGSYGVAYLMYDITGATQPSGGNNIPFKGYEQSLTFSGSLVTDGTVIFDLDATEYCSSFVVRPFVVLQNKADATDTHCVYGAQYEYGLEAYVTKMYGQTGSKAFKYLLAEAWDYAVAADAYIKVHPSEVTA